MILNSLGFKKNQYKSIVISPLSITGRLFENKAPFPDLAQSTTAQSFCGGATPVFLSSEPRGVRLESGAPPQ